MTPSIHLPSTANLLKATALALAIAGVVLVSVVLPAEYGIDPTGVGEKLGVDVLAGAQAAEAAPAPVAKATPTKAAPAAADATGLDAVGQPIQPIDATPLSDRDGAIRTGTLSVTLAPGKGAEIKADMAEGAAMLFRWTATRDVAFDMHGEPKDGPKDTYTSYWIEPARREASGSFTAPFAGRHGWYWLNRGTEPVTITVEVTGFQGDLFFPQHAAES